MSGGDADASVRKAEKEARRSRNDFGKCFILVVPADRSGMTEPRIENRLPEGIGIGLCVEPKSSALGCGKHDPLTSAGR